MSGLHNNKRINVHYLALLIAKLKQCHFERQQRLFTSCKLMIFIIAKISSVHIKPLLIVQCRRYEYLFVVRGLCFDQFALSPKTANAKCRLRFDIIQN